MSLATGVHHVWQHRGKIEADALEAVEATHPFDSHFFLPCPLLILQAKYLSHTKRSPAIQLGDVSSEHDLTLIALFLCIPLASLMWAILAFAIAASAFCLQNSTGLTRIFLGAVIAVMVIASAGTVAFFWNIWVKPPTKELDEDEGMMMSPAAPLPSANTKNALQHVHNWGSSLRDTTLRAWRGVVSRARASLNKSTERTTPDVELAQRTPAPTASQSFGGSTEVAAIQSASFQVNAPSARSTTAH